MFHGTRPKPPWGAGKQNFWAASFWSLFKRVEPILKTYEKAARKTSCPKTEYRNLTRFRAPWLPWGASSANIPAERTPSKKASVSFSGSAEICWKIDLTSPVSIAEKWSVSEQLQPADKCCEICSSFASAASVSSASPQLSVSLSSAVQLVDDSSLSDAVLPTYRTAWVALLAGNLGEIRSRLFPNPNRKTFHRRCAS